MVCGLFHIILTFGDRNHSSNCVIGWRSTIGQITIKMRVCCGVTKHLTLSQFFKEKTEI